MGALFTAKGVDGSAIAIGFSPPVLGAGFFNYFGDTAAKTARNLIVGKPTPIVVGSPVISAGYASFTGNANWIDTAIAETGDITFLVACRWPNAQASAFNFAMSTFQGPAAALSSRVAAGASIYLDNKASPGSIKIAASRLNGSTGVATTSNLPNTTDVTPWSFYVMRLDNTRQQLQDLTRGLIASAAQSYPRDPTGQTIRLGYGYTDGANGKVDLAFAASYPRFLSDAEMMAVYQKAQAYLAGKSIIV